MITWQPGDTIVERHILFNTVFSARPMTVVSDADGVLATYLAIGTRWFAPMFEDRATALDEIGRGDVRWGEKTWVQNNVLALTRAGDAYSPQAFHNEEGTFVGWYINLQEPMRRTTLGFDTRDHSLDIIVGTDLSWWQWKDEEETERAVQMGLFSRHEADEIRRNGEAVIELIEHGDVWWAHWSSWKPDPSSPIPTLPEGWDRV